MKKVKVKADCWVYFKGHSSQLLKDTEYEANAEIVTKNPSLFVEVPATVVKETKSVKVKEVVKEEPKEELLIEEPVAPLEVTEEVTPKKRARSKK